MRFPEVRVSMRQLMAVIAVLAFGLAISPSWAPYLAVLPLVTIGLASLRHWALTYSAIIMLVFCSLIEITLLEPVAGWIYAPIAILISGPLWPERSTMQRPEHFVPLILVNALVLGIFLMPWSTRKPFLRHLYSIRPGMTVAEARRIMAGYKEYLDFSMSTTDEMSRVSGSLTFRHSDDPQFNIDLGRITIQEGKVIDVRFLHD